MLRPIALELADEVVGALAVVVVPVLFPLPAPAPGKAAGVVVLAPLAGVVVVSVLPPPAWAGIVGVVVLLPEPEPEPLAEAADVADEESPPMVTGVPAALQASFKAGEEGWKKSGQSVPSQGYS